MMLAAHVMERSSAPPQPSGSITCVHVPVQRPEVTHVENDAVVQDLGAQRESCAALHDGGAGAAR
jgi:hypothetical protein